MPAGRPADLDRPLGTITTDDGERTVTVSERIVASLRAGNYLEPSAAAAGVSKAVVYNWLKTAGYANKRYEGDRTRMTPFEERCCRFLDAIDEAQGIWEVGALTQLERLARGGIEIKKTTTKYNSDGTVERTETIEHTLPDKQVLEWRLERRHEDRWGRKLRIEETPATLPVADHADALINSLDDYLAGVADASRPD